MTKLHQWRDPTICVRHISRGRRSGHIHVRYLTYRAGRHCIPRHTRCLRFLPCRAGGIHRIAHNCFRRSICSPRGRDQARNSEDDNSPLSHQVRVGGDNRSCHSRGPFRIPCDHNFVDETRSRCLVHGGYVDADFRWSTVTFPRVRIFRGNSRNPNPARFHRGMIR